MNENRQALQRLRNVLLQDKIQSYEGFLRVLRGDLFALLQCYMHIVGDVDVALDPIEDDRFRLRVELKADHIRTPQTLP